MVYNLRKIGYNLTVRAEGQRAKGRENACGVDKMRFKDVRLYKM